jgi:hypothetical protein
MYTEYTKCETNASAATRLRHGDRAAVSAAALDNDNQARRPGLSTEGTRGGVAAVV